MRTVDVFYAFPSVLLAIAISGALGAGIVNSIVSLTIVFVPQITASAESVTTGCATWISSRPRAPPAGAVHHHARTHAGQCARSIFVYATGLISVSMILAPPVVPGARTKPPERNGA